MRQPLVLGNWKMNGNRQLVAEFVPALRQQLAPTAADCGICIPFTLLTDARLAIAIEEDTLNAAEIGLGAQNVSAQQSGAFTGEVSLDMLAEMACDFVILGHSERRQYQNETDELIAEKTLAACNSAITPVLCVGETLTEREAGQVEQVISRQLDAVLSKLNEEQLANLVIAYEPVWAIGTGVTASPEQAQEVHAFIRGQIAKVNGTIADQIRLLYGGSMKPDNATALMGQTDIDGGLVGGASLNATDFAAICNAA